MEVTIPVMIFLLFPSAVRAERRGERGREGEKGDCRELMQCSKPCKYSNENTHTVGENNFRVTGDLSLYRSERRMELHIFCLVRSIAHSSVAVSGHIQPSIMG